MNKIKNKMIKDVTYDKFEFEYNLCEQIKIDIYNILKDYFKIIENTSVVSLKIKKDFSVLFNFSCEIKEIDKSNF